MDVISESDVTAGSLCLMVPSLCSYIWSLPLPKVLHLMIKYLSRVSIHYFTALQAGIHLKNSRVKDRKVILSLQCSQQISINLVWRAHYLSQDLLLVLGTYIRNVLSNVLWFLLMSTKRPWVSWKYIHYSLIFSEIHHLSAALPARCSLCRANFEFPIAFTKHGSQY